MENELMNLCSRPILQPKDLDRIAALLQVGIDPNCTNTDGQTPLLLCLTNQDGQSRLTCLKILLKDNQSRYERSRPKKVDVNAKDRQQRNAFQLLLDEKAAMNDPMAFESLKLLIVEGGIDLKWTDISGRNALHYLCLKCEKENIADAIELLVENGVDFKSNDPLGRIALHYLCENYKNENIVDVIKFLIDKGIDVEAKDKVGRTALHYLCQHYKNDNIIDAIELLVKNGVDINLEDDFESSALDYMEKDSKMARLKEKFFLKSDLRKEMIDIRRLGYAPSHDFKLTPSLSSILMNFSLAS